MAELNTALDFKAELQGMERYEAEMENHFWKPIEGKHEVVVTADHGWIEQTWKDGTKSTQRKLGIDVLGKSFVWTIPKGQTKRSLWGQICQHAVENGGVLIGKPFTLKVIGSGKQRNYIVV